MFDHFHTVPEPTDEMTFESFAVLAALAVSTERVRLGHMVVCTGFRNPALTAKQSSTIDVISGGRFELGIGAGWKEDEWRAYGYGFPPLAERLAVFGDHLAVITEMFAPGPRHASRVATPTCAGRSTSRAGSRSRASRSSSAATGRRSPPAMRSSYADELNYVFLDPDEIADRMRQVRERCEAEGRDPATLRFSMYVRDEHMRDAGQARVDLIARFAEIGLDRLVAFPTRWSPTLEAQAAFAADCEAAGIALEGARSRLVEDLDRVRDRLRRPPRLAFVAVTTSWFGAGDDEVLVERGARRSPPCRARSGSGWPRRPGT